MALKQYDSYYVCVHRSTLYRHIAILKILSEHSACGILMRQAWLFPFNYYQLREWGNIIKRQKSGNEMTPSLEYVCAKKGEGEIIILLLICKAAVRQFLRVMPERKWSNLFPAITWTFILSSSYTFTARLLKFSSLKLEKHLTCMHSAKKLLIFSFYRCCSLFVF